MAFKEGETYKCPDPKCACEITVTKGAASGGAASGGAASGGAASGKGGSHNPHCCCGKEMVRK